MSLVYWNSPQRMEKARQAYYHPEEELVPPCGELHEDHIHTWMYYLHCNDPYYVADEVLLEEEAAQRSRLV